MDQDFFQRLFYGRQHYHPPETDPAKFPRSEEIGDEEILMRLAETQRLVERYEELEKQVDVLKDEMTVIKADVESQRVRIFQRLKQLFPVIAEGYGVGWRKHGETYYCVGWDDPNAPKASEQQQQEDNDGV